MPRSQRITSAFPSLATYSAAMRSSSIEADGPRLISTGFGARPTSDSRLKFCMFRAPIWITSAVSTTASTSRGSISSVTSGRPVSSRASARILRPSTPSPWKAYGEVRGLKAPPRSIVTPCSATTRAVSNVCSRVSTVHGPAMKPKYESPIRRPRVSITVGSRRSSRETSLYGLTIGSTCSTPGYPSSGRVASSSRSPIAPITVASRPWLTCALAPASSRRATTSSISWVDAWAPITIRSSGDPTTAMRASLDVPRIRAMRVFSGIQPTGDKHLGNLIGGFRQYAATQERGEAFFCIVDLHSITVEYDPVEFRERTLDLAAIMFATGLDPERSTVFAQSHVPAHAEAAWLLGAVTSYGQLGRMTQFKDKSDRHEFISAGLFTYPVLMAGDILLYQTDIVPIGDDQRQHLELTRDVAERFNSRFGETFKLPEGVYPEVGARIMDLQEPANKMSTTGGTPQGTVKLLDEPDTIRKKFRSAVTDSGSEVRRADDKPGVTNLIDILSALTGEPPDAIESRYDGAGYGQFKTDVGDAVVEAIEPIQTRFRSLRSDPAELQRLLARGAEKARKASEPTLEAMYERMGFVKPELGRFFGAARPRSL